MSKRLSSVHKVYSMSSEVRIYQRMWTSSYKFVMHLGPHI
jgi:hypothetical protein